MTGRRRPAKVRFWEKVALPDENGCMRWLGAMMPQGYGSFRVADKAVTAHRFSYELAEGPIPAGLHIDHLCRNRRCAAPAHLEPVTPGENARRGDAWKVNGLKTHCPRGHAYSPENTWVYRGSRFCKACDRIRGIAYRARLKARKLAASEGEEG